MRLTHGGAVWLMVVVTLMWGTAGVVTRHLAQAHSFEITFWRSLFTTLALLVILPLWRGRAVFSQLRRGGREIWISGVCWAVMFTAFMVALTLASTASVLVTMSLGPLFTALAARFFIGHRLPARTWLAIVVAGAGTQLEKAATLVQNRQLADVSFAGEIHGEAKYAVLRAADAYLFPSHSEGLPISVLEAMACGLPVVTRSVGGLQDFFEHGKMGFITASREPRVFASLLSRLIQDPMLRSRMSAFNHAYAREHFTAPQIAAQLGRVYRLLRESAHPAVLRAG